MSTPVVLITGALTGIGRATALAFAHEGASLILISSLAAGQTPAGRQKVRLPYMQRFRDRQGHLRFYVRNAEERIAIKAEEGTPEFTAAYQAALIELGLVFLPNMRPWRASAMHRPANHGWEHWRICRSISGSNWRRIKRTKCVDDAEKIVNPE
jgi:hypothetical protein